MSARLYLKPRAKHAGCALSGFSFETVTKHFRSLRRGTLACAKIKSVSIEHLQRPQIFHCVSRIAAVGVILEHVLFNFIFVDW